MKNISKYYLLVLSVVLLGCELNEEPIGLITRDQINTEPTASSVTSSVNSSYQLLSNTLNIIGEWDWTGGKVLRNDFILQDIAAGDMNKKWNPDGDQAWMDEVAAFNFTAINGAFNGIWSYDYEGISRANMAINTLNNPDITDTGLDAATKDRLLGEAYFLRAFYYFDLLNHFGGVPLLTEPLEDFSAAYEVSNRASEEEVIALIENDLETAVGLLPMQKYSSNAEPWRVSIGAAKGMQAKVDLFQENWEMSLAHIEELQAWNFYSLNDHYFDSFDVEKEFMEDEVIFAYDHRAELNPSKGNGLAALMGWGFVAPTENFVNAFEDDDPRLEYTIETETQSPHKLLGSTDSQYKGNDDSPGNKVYIRYADVLLWKAEALIETGQVEAGLEIVDQIRMRAENTPSLDGSNGELEMYSGSGLSQEQALEVLYKERRLELGFESHRINDLKRWGIADEVLTEMGKNFQEYNYLYPIPQGEIDRSGGQIEQNPGY
ncbi:RagB/SusD family nutrient uptake outer membrane protein [Salegentibacter salegens]|uniref:Starch-binding associating with outer membrane n=2 Tax=Salegentibacter salegens TaxID=143223 RepID=A0A1M7HNN1_9FLAO|nr:RagB/SusD family nutrient uptake outer membrane protein [Salegentibacter salegens]PRX39609.1 putative outer membrane starch-binding protein [Salegentibacter salegens]SHM30030.1 Starch-binding associating with outer membrane [Salegentibacter salegens]